MFLAGAGGRDARGGAAGAADAFAEGNAALAEVVGRHFDLDAVAFENTDVVLAHLARDVGQDFGAVIKFDLKQGVGQGGGDYTFEFDDVVFGHWGLLTWGR